MQRHPIFERSLAGLRPRFTSLIIPLLGLAVLTAPAPVLAQSSACDSLVAAAIGGPIPAKNDDTMVLRWLGNANYEVSYRGQGFLFDTYFNRKPGNRPR